VRGFREVVARRDFREREKKGNNEEARDLLGRAGEVRNKRQ
jgi:hypothetical protein